MNGVACATAALMLTVFVVGPVYGTAPVRPFENTGGRRPSVSPYMNLVNNPQAGATNYQSLVRPQLDQSAVNRQQRAAINQLQRQAPGRPQSGAQGNQKLRGTGHHTEFNNTSRYFPQSRK